MLSAIHIYSRLADLILLAHALFVAFVVLGFLIIWVGYFARWRFVYGWRFRLAHMLAMAFVLAEAVLGLTCPLTTWENALRLRSGEDAYGGSFIQHWVGRCLFYECGEGTFTVLYAGFFALILLTFWIVPPRRTWPGQS